MSDPKKTFVGVRAKLKKHADDHAEAKKATLPKSGIEVEIPQFINHGEWMKAQRQAGGDTSTAQAAFVIGAVKFEGEKLTMADIKVGLLDAKDMLFLISEIFGDDDDNDNDNDDEEGDAGKKPEEA